MDFKLQWPWWRDFFFTVFLWMQLVVWGPWGDMLWDQMGSLVVTQVPCSYMTSQSDLLISLTISWPNTHKGQINTAGCDWRQWAGSWGRWADLDCCFGVNVLEKCEEKVVMFLGCCLWLSMYIVNIMCKQVNKSTWLQHGSCFLSMFLPSVELCKYFSQQFSMLYVQ